MGAPEHKAEVLPDLPARDSTLILIRNAVADSRTAIPELSLLGVGWALMELLGIVLHEHTDRDRRDATAIQIAALAVRLVEEKLA